METPDMDPLDGKRILVVEDEAVIAAMIEDMLEDLGAVVVGPVNTVARGLALAGDAAIDAAVLDVNLRGERVDPVARLLARRGVPVVIASGYGESGEFEHDGAVLTKPFTLADLGRVLESALRDAGDQSGGRLVTQT
ncbi:response regulator [Alsobacter sp. SYSU M60028]|uniref:Response regulator n=1 Tax=Alsobacter ponti TaxID=2962936 RepID=A0ABT1LHX7_9HYPH|nr:response regulator [Alsobacter ponti]MCP8940478.1 response regulator [Alsobacter ponti]